VGSVLIYGATGYTGRLLADELVRHGISPTLAGRAENVREAGRSMDLPTSVFALDDDAAAATALADAAVLINVAGPFGRTQKPLIRACIASGTHYLDIAGEVAEVRSAFEFDEQASRAGVMVMPAAGFGVVPTDIAAAEAARLVPDATSLAILYATDGGVSRGTLRTVLKDIDRPGFRRSGGTLVQALPAESERRFEVAGKSFKAVYNPWRADLFTAGQSTGIPEIGTWSVFPGVIVRMMKGRLLWLRDLILNHGLRWLPDGPGERQLRAGRTYVTAIAEGDPGSQSVSLTGPEAYVFTVRCVRALTQKILAGGAMAGCRTPSVFGRELLDDIDGVEWC